MARTHQQFIADVKARNDNNPSFPISIKAGSFYKGLDYDITMVCGKGHGDFVTKPRHIIQKQSGCPQCSPAKIQKTAAKTAGQLVQQLLITNPTIRLNPGQVYINAQHKLSFRCQYGHTFDSRPSVIVRGGGCPACAKLIRRHQSPHEVQLSGTGGIQQEVDNFVREHKLPITVLVVGLHAAYDKYFHSRWLEQQRQQQYTIMLFEDEWVNNSELIKRKLLHYSGNSTTVRIHARKCQIRECSSADKRQLLQRNHVQGHDNARVAYGAYFNDKLIAVMTFTPPRVSVGHKRNDYSGVWELSRFCTDTDFVIPGIASKLLKHFQRNHQWTQIYSYADKRWSVGNMYAQLGFEPTANNPPGYFYVVDGKRKHRWAFRKDVLKNTLEHYDSSLTEYQNMVNHGYWRVWDCGTLKFTMHNSQADQ